jgi:predicted alpha/beta hydrolase family esterase
MKSNIFILHSLNGDTLETWGKELKEIFEAKNIEVNMSKFPIRDESTYEKFENILKSYIDNGKLNENSIIVAHSIGNAYFVRFCKELNFVPKVYIAVAPGAIYEYHSTRNDYIVEVKKQAYCKKDALDFVKNNLKKKFCLYSDEDDNNIEKFTRFIEDIGAKGIYLKGYNHFDGYHNIESVPELVELVGNLI